MVSSINSALSGLTAASARLNVAAENIANQNSTRTLKNGQVTNEPYQPQELLQSSLAEGGVTTSVQPADKPPALRFDPQDPGANENGLVASPDVDPVQELVNAQLASYDFKANLKTLKAQDELLQNTLDILA